MYGMPVGMRTNLPDISRAEGKCEYVHVMRDGQRASLNHSNEEFGKGVQDQVVVYDTSFVVGYRYRLSLGTGFHLDGHPVADPIQTQRIVNDYPNVSYTVILHYIYSL